MSELTNVIQHPQEAVARIAELEQRNASLIECGNELKKWHIRKNHYHQYTCELCDCYADTADGITHAPDCAITKWGEVRK